METAAKKKNVILKEEPIEEESKDKSKSTAKKGNKKKKGSSKKSITTSNKQNVQIVYESEDAYAAEAFKKYMLFQELDKGKTGPQIKEFVVKADYYLENFKTSRDSEFSEYDEIDLTRLKQERN